MFTNSYFNPYNLNLISRYIVYLSEAKFTRNSDKRELVSYTDKIQNPDTFFDIFITSQKMGIVTDSEEFLDFYNLDEVKNLALQYDCNILLEIYKKDSNKIFILDSNMVKNNIKQLLLFCVRQRNDLILIDLDTSKTFISHNSYYLTNSITEEDKHNFPIAYITDKEVIHKISIDYSESLESTLDL